MEFFLILYFLIILFSPLHKQLINKVFLFINLFIATVLIAIYFISFYGKDLDTLKLRQAGFLFAPLLFIGLYKLFDLIQLKISARHFIIPNKFIMTDWESKYWNVIDLIGFFVVLLLPILGGIGIAELIMKIKNIH